MRFVLFLVWLLCFVYASDDPEPSDEKEDAPNLFEGHIIGKRTPVRKKSAPIDIPPRQIMDPMRDP